MFGKENLQLKLIHAFENGRILMVEVQKEEEYCYSIFVHQTAIKRQSLKKLYRDTTIREYEECCIVDFIAVFGKERDSSKTQRGKKELKAET